VGESVSLLREPDAGDPPVRFDERDVETEHGEPRNLLKNDYTRSKPHFGSDYFRTEMTYDAPIRHRDTLQVTRFRSGVSAENSFSTSS